MRSVLKNVVLKTVLSYCELSGVIVLIPLPKRLHSLIFSQQEYLAIIWQNCNQTRLDSCYSSTYRQVVNRITRISMWITHNSPRFECTQEKLQNGDWYVSVSKTLAKTSLAPQCVLHNQCIKMIWKHRSFSDFSPSQGKG